ncbi:hypothetical protein EB796_023412 [Bugula neritina]|uniref:guanylate cyclase n=1 Tax=Bugula neritina TaxID=10212 RepID=A0A7J7IWJ1_BUGNE|nr:hypothetical protein EB796_023412 [Bugula neritina]
MYGLLLEGIYSYLRVVFGEETLTKVRQKANITHSGFDSFRVYSETVIPRLARAAQDVTGMPQEELMESFGVSFVSYMSRYNYDSYPKIKPPSFFVTDETEDGLTLHYRSKRKGFKSYLKGQIRQVGKEFYNTDIKCHELEVDDSHGIFYVKMRLSFDNSEGFANLHFVTQLCEMNMPITSSDLFRLFPFHMVLSRELVLTSVGKAILPVLPHALGCQVDDLFHLERPIMEFSWESILSHTNNIFELKSVDGIENRFEDSFDDMSVDKLSDTDISLISADQTNQNDSLNKYLTLRGQMLHMEQWNAILFLGTPVLENLDHMFKLGLYINDLSIHDSSRELVLAGTQQSAELKLLLDQEQTKSKKLEESMRKLDIEIKRTDQLLYQMIPKSVANRLRAGEPSVNTCEVFDICTILFSDVVGFTTICSAISPMEVVNLLNGMYTTFDTLIEKFQLYKVETIGDAYMIAGGIPKPCDKHASSIAEMAFAMLNAMKTLKDPSDETDTGAHLKLRVGIHSGTVVGGVVGLKMPRYCLFGDTVNTANRMESTGQAMRVHCSQSVKNCLDGNKQYSFEQRGSIEIKGKGQMKTYWLTCS